MVTREEIGICPCCGKKVWVVPKDSTFAGVPHLCYTVTSTANSVSDNVKVMKPKTTNQFFKNFTNKGKDRWQR